MSQDTRFTENFSRKRLFVVISDSRECAQWIEHGEKHGYGYFQLVWVRLTIRENWWSKIIHLDRTKRVLSFERVKPCYRVSHIVCYEESWESQKFFSWCFALSGNIRRTACYLSLRNRERCDNLRTGKEWSLSKKARQQNKYVSSKYPIWEPSKKK